MTDTRHLTPDTCYIAALRILNYRFNSGAELRRKLARKGFDAGTIDATLTRLAAEKWLDDERFAGAFVRTRMSKKHGRNRIARELEASGVGEEIARRAVAENADPERERAAAIDLCRKKMRLLARRHGDDWIATSEGRNKLTGYLLNQGYDAALVRSVVPEIIKEFQVAHD